ncbi:23593_t:CDS:2 [Gigaspora rosea]|nr:23593_t:CDS:2 [Gigaspora rosea]
MPEYFRRNPESWSILDFLRVYPRTVLDFYIKSLLTIIKSHKSSVRERESAQVLFDKYKKASKILGRLLADPTLDPLGLRTFIRKGLKPDRTKAMEWEKKCTQKQVHIQNAGTVINETNGGTFENINGEIKPIQKKSINKESVGSAKKVSTNAKTTKDTLSSSHGTSEVNSSGYGRPHTPPHQIQSAPRNKDLISPHKPTLYEHTAKYMSKHFSISINQDCVITKTNQSVKDKFKSSIMTSFNPDHPFRKICEIILYDFEATLNRDIGERKYTVDRIVPLFKAIESIYREYVFDWIEVQANCIEDVKSVFPEFDFTLNKVDGIGFKAGSNKELVFIEISGRPENPVEKHVKEDTEKLIKEAMFGLISLLRDYLDKNAEYTRNICTYMVQGIGDRITLSKLQLDQKHFYKILQIKSAKLPFSFDEVEKYLESELKGVEKTNVFKFICGTEQYCKHRKVLE